MRQYYGVAPGRRVFSRVPELQTGAVGNPQFTDSSYRNGAPFIQTHDALVEQMGDSENFFTKRFPRTIQFVSKCQFPMAERRAIIFGTECCLL